MIATELGNAVQQQPLVEITEVAYIAEGLHNAATIIVLIVA